MPAACSSRIHHCDAAALQHDCHLPALGSSVHHSLVKASVQYLLQLYGWWQGSSRACRLDVPAPADSPRSPGSCTAACCACSCCRQCLQRTAAGCTCSRCCQCSSSSSRRACSRGLRCFLCTTAWKMGLMQRAGSQRWGGAALAAAVAALPVADVAAQDGSSCCHCYL